MDSSYLGRAFQDGKQLRDEQDGLITLRSHTLGELVITTGKVVACDAFVFDTEPFVQTFPLGRYPVIVSVAEFASNKDQRVAFAMLSLTEQPVVRWAIATHAGQDASTLKEDEIFGYPVDAGTGCFMDLEAALAYERKCQEQHDYSLSLVDEMAKNDVFTWGWMNICLVPETGANLIAFSSGWGDGFYASYLGYNAAGAVACVVTDFEVFDPALLLNS